MRQVCIWFVASSLMMVAVDVQGANGEATLSQGPFWACTTVLRSERINKLQGQDPALAEDFAGKNGCRSMDKGQKVWVMDRHFNDSDGLGWTGVRRDNETDIYYVPQ